MIAVELHEATFTLPLPVSVNAMYYDKIYYASSGKPYARRHASQALIDYKAVVAQCLTYGRIVHEAWQEATSLGIEADIYTMSRRADLDDFLKSMIDSIAETLGFNDNIIDDLHMRRHIDKMYPHVDVRLFVIP